MPSPAQSQAVQRAVRIRIEQLEDLSCPPLVLPNLVCAEQPDAERSELLVVERPFNFNIEPRQYRQGRAVRGRAIHRPRHVQPRCLVRHAVALFTPARRSHDCRSNFRRPIVICCARIWGGSNLLTNQKVIYSFKDL